MRRICPVCSTRRNQLIDPDCLVCAGSGFLTLGGGALSIYDPHTVAEAVHIALEAAARADDTALTLSDDRTGAIRETLRTLAQAGILALPSRPRPPAPRPVTTLPRKRTPKGQYAIEVTPSELAQQFVQTELIPLDPLLAAAPAYTYTEDERPNARGLPLLSANGHPSHLARVADPMEPGSDTRAECRARGAQTLRARALVEAAPEAARRRVRKHQKQKQQEALAA